MAGQRPELVEAIEGEVGDSLRAVATYDRDGYTIVHAREGITDRVREYAEDIHTELILQGIGREHLEDLFDAGDLHCSMHRFDGLTAFHFVQAEYTGVFVSIDTDCSMDLHAFAQTVQEQLD